MEKVKCVIKRVDSKQIQINELEDELKTYQDIVGGHIECVGVGKGVIMICNEDGRGLGLPINFYVEATPICGDVIFCSANGEEFASLDEGQISSLKTMLDGIFFAKLM